MNLLIINIALLVNVREDNKLLRGEELSFLPCIENAYLIIKEGRIFSYGTMENLPATDNNILKTINANGAFVLPCWCDSHTHLVFAASREEEFVDKIKGLS
jgi:imidazolonepropionase